MNRSRSVTTPRSFPSLTTGRIPQSACSISAAAAARFVSGDAVTGSCVMSSEIFMIASRRFRGAVLDFDLFLAIGFRGRRQRHGDLEHTVGERRFYVLGLHAFRKRHGAVEAAVFAFRPIHVVRLFLSLALALAGQ